MCEIHRPSGVPLAVVFLDRDGVINENRDDYAKAWAQVRFLPGVFEALARLSLTLFRIVVLAEKCHPPGNLPVSPNNPEGLSILSDGFSNGCVFSASTASISALFGFYTITQKGYSS